MYNIPYYLLVILFSFLFSLSVGYFLDKLPLPKHFFDFPNKRKIHTIPTLNIGGVLILSTLIISSFLFGLVENDNYRYYLILCTVFFLIGLLDDINDWNYKKKFITQFIATLLFMFIISIDGSIFVFSSVDLQIPYLNYILLTIFIIGIINSFNFFDGINWLAGSIAIIIFFSYGILNSQQLDIAYSIYLILIFSVMGFLFFNRSPAKMFLGDSGSNLLGFLIATLPLILFKNDSSAVNLTIPVIVTSILYMEAVYLAIYRIMNGKNPFHPDKNHLHHLLRVKLQNRYVVILISFATILLSLVAYYSNILLFYQIVLIEILFFGVIIVLPRIVIKQNI